MNRKLEFHVSAYRYFEDNKWTHWQYEVAPFLDGQLIRDKVVPTCSLDQASSHINNYVGVGSSRLLPSKINQNMGRDVGVHLDYHGGNPVQVREANDEELAELTRLVFEEIAFEEKVNAQPPPHQLQE